MNWFKRLLRSMFSSVVTSRYIIVHDPRYGYAACVYEFGAYYTITKHGTTGVTIDSAKDPFYGSGKWVATEAEAGERINFHSRDAEQRVVWP